MVLVLWKRKLPFNWAGIEPDSLVFPVFAELSRPLNTTITHCYTEFESPNITSAPEIGTVVAMLLLLMFQS
jgi:hypothetical protein